MYICRFFNIRKILSFINLPQSCIYFTCENWGENWHEIDMSNSSKIEWNSGELLTIYCGDKINGDEVCIGMKRATYLVCSLKDVLIIPF